MVGYLCKSLRIIILVWPTRLVVLAMGEVLSFGFDLVVSFPSDRRGSKARIVSFFLLYTARQQPHSPLLKPRSKRYTKSQKRNKVRGRGYLQREFKVGKLSKKLDYLYIYT